MFKISLLLSLQTSRVNNSKILRIKNAKFSVYCFYMNINMKEILICMLSACMQTVIRFSI